MDKKKVIISIGLPDKKQSFIKEAYPQARIIPIEEKDHLDKTLQTKNPDLIIFSSQFQKTNNLKILKALIQRYPETTAFIYVIRHNEENLAKLAQKEGLQDIFIEDQLTPSLLRLSIHRAFEQKKWLAVYQNISQSESNFNPKDESTGLYKSSYFKTRLAEESQRSQRYDFPLSLLLFELDDHDKLNQKLSSNEMEKLIIDLSKILKRKLRSTDLLSRTQAYEFALLLPHTNLKEAQVVWKRLSKEIAEIPFSVSEDNIFIQLKGSFRALNSKIETIDQFLDDMRQNFDTEINLQNTITLQKN